jgi:hypothetical protein
MTHDLTTIDRLMIRLAARSTDVLPGRTLEAMLARRTPSELRIGDHYGFQTCPVEDRTEHAAAEGVAPDHPLCCAVPTAGVGAATNGIGDEHAQRHRLGCPPRQRVTAHAASTTALRKAATTDMMPAPAFPADQRKHKQAGGAIGPLAARFRTVLPLRKVRIKSTNLPPQDPDGRGDPAREEPTKHIHRPGPGT